jgi:hypothetical protein
MSNRSWMPTASDPKPTKRKKCVHDPRCAHTTVNHHEDSIGGRRHHLSGDHQYLRMSEGLRLLGPAESFFNFFNHTLSVLVVIWEVVASRQGRVRRFPVEIVFLGCSCGVVGWGVAGCKVVLSVMVVRICIVVSRGFGVCGYRVRPRSRFCCVFCEQMSQVWY